MRYMRYMRTSACPAASACHAFPPPVTRIYETYYIYIYIYICDIYDSARDAFMTFLFRTMQLQLYILL
jgi:hypothetical protein